MGLGAPPLPPPKKNKTWLWVALSVGAVAVVALLVTGFAAPGFFLGDADDDTVAEGGSGDSGGGGGSDDDPAAGIEPVVTKILTALEELDDDALNSVICEDADSMVKQHAFSDLPSTLDVDASVDSVDQNSDSTVVVKIVLDEENVGERAQEYMTGKLEKDQGDWCFMEFKIKPSDSGSAGESGSPESSGGF